MTFGQKNSRNILLFCIGFLLLGISFYLGYVFRENSFYFGKNSSFTNNGESVSAAVFSDKKSLEVYKLIEENYYGFSQKTTKNLEDAFLSALVKSLGDKHSEYFNEQETKEFNELLLGDFEGIGAVIEEDPRGVKIAKVITASPAEDVGLQSGDVIIKVDGKNIAGFTPDEAVEKIRGPKGTDVIIEYVRTEGQTNTVRVTRDIVNIPSVASKILDDNIGYIEVASFGEHTNDEFKKALTSVTDSGATAIILDLRDNGGGYLNTAVQMLSLFLPDNTVAVKIKENDARKNETLYTHSSIFSLGDTTKIPMIVLVNGLSASASEIVSGALQDHERALILGDITYGKGSVQEPYSLKDGSMVKLTVAKWYTPDDREIDAKGIEPDIAVTLLDEDYKNQNDRQLNAALEVMKTLQKNNGNVSKTVEVFKNTIF